MDKSAAGVLFVENGRILMVKTSYKQHWDIPGGMVEKGETPKQAAAREVQEELGVAVVVDRLLVIDSLVLPTGDLLNAFIFFGVHIDTKEIKVDGEEVVGWEWCSYSQLLGQTKTAPLFRDRVVAAYAAYEESGVSYLGRHA